jgi:hypothetical protein
MLRVWFSPDDGEHQLRPTLDIDMLGKTSNEEASIIAQIREIMAVDVEPDGLTFNPDSIQSERIAYAGMGGHSLWIWHNAAILSGIFLRETKRKCVFSWACI